MFLTWKYKQCKCLGHYGVNNANVGDNRVWAMQREAYWWVPLFCRLKSIHLPLPVFLGGKSHRFSTGGKETNYLGPKSVQNAKRSSLTGNFVLQAGRCVSSLLWTPQDVVPWCWRAWPATRNLLQWSCRGSLIKRWDCCALSLPVACRLNFKVTAAAEGWNWKLCHTWQVCLFFV